VQPLKQKKPPSHESTTEKSPGALSSNLVQPPKQKKPTTIKKMVEPISKRKLAWETIEEEGKMMIGAQHVREFFNNLNTKQQRRELEKTKNVDPGKLGFFKLMSENNKKMMPIMVSMSSKEDTCAKVGVENRCVDKPTDLRCLRPQCTGTSSSRNAYTTSSASP
jgi:hypothetical protein